MTQHCRVFKWIHSKTKSAQITVSPLACANICSLEPSTRERPVVYMVMVVAVWQVDKIISDLEGKGQLYV